MLRIIGEVQAKDQINLHDMQVLMGNLNNVGMMSPVLKSFKRPLNDFLAYVQENENETIKFAPQAKKGPGCVSSFFARRKNLESNRP